MANPENPKTGVNLNRKEYFTIMESFGIKQKRKGSVYCGASFLDNLGYIYKRNHQSPEKIFYRCIFYSVGGHNMCCPAWVHVFKSNPNKIVQVRGFPHLHPSKFQPEECKNWVNKIKSVTPPLKKAKDKIQGKAVISSKLAKNGCKRKFVVRKTIRKPSGVVPKRVAAKNRTFSKSSKSEILKSSNISRKLIADAKENVQNLSSISEKNLDLLQKLNLAEKVFEEVSRNVKKKKDEVALVKHNHIEIDVMKTKMDDMKKKTRVLRELEKMEVSIASTAHHGILYKWHNWNLCLVADNLFIKSDNLIIKISPKSANELVLISIADNCAFKLKLDEKFGVYKLVIEGNHCQNLTNLAWMYAEECSGQENVLQPIFFQNWVLQCVTFGKCSKGFKITYSQSKKWDLEESFAVLHQFIGNGLWVVSENHNIFPVAVSTTEEEML